MQAGLPSGASVIWRSCCLIPATGSTRDVKPRKQPVRVRTGPHGFRRSPKSFALLERSRTRAKAFRAGTWNKKIDGDMETVSINPLRWWVGVLDCGLADAIAADARAKSTSASGSTPLKRLSCSEPLRWHRSSRSAADEELSGAREHQGALLLGRLGVVEPHVGPSHCSADCPSISGIVLRSLDVRLRISRPNQAHVMPKCFERA